MAVAEVAASAWLRSWSGHALGERRSWAVTTILLFAALGLLAVLFLIVLTATAYQRSELRPNYEAIGLGAATNFFDTLGIGSFAPTTAYLKLRKLVPDSYMPAVLNAGHALPTLVQALVFIHLIYIDPLLLLGCIAAAVNGALIGTQLATKVATRHVQWMVGLAMLIAAALYAATNLDLLPAGGDAFALGGAKFAVAVMAHLVLGMLMSFGIGLYAPSLVILSLLGLSPTAAFPVMMGACAFLMPISGMGFVRSRRIDLKVVIGLAIGGVPAVMLAAYVVKQLPLAALRWGVVSVALYTALLLLRSAAKSRRVARVPARPN